MMATGGTEGKGSSGAKFRPPPANVWNNMIDAGRAWADSQLDSPGGPPTRSRSTDIIKIQNISGAARRTGEVLKIEGKAIDSITAEHIWLIGVEPTADCCFGILKKPVADDGIEQLQVSGVCLALVDVTNAEHTRAGIIAASYVLESSDFGPLEILYKPSGTGEKECVVRFAGGGGGGTHEVWATIEHVECDEYTQQIEYVLATPIRYTGGRSTTSIPEIDSYGMIRVESVCSDIFTAHYTSDDLQGKTLRATYMWDIEAEEPVQKWYVDGVCGAPECA